MLCSHCCEDPAAPSKAGLCHSCAAYRGRTGALPGGDVLVARWRAQAARRRREWFRAELEARLARTGTE